jgi:hypothetical protein
VFYCQFKSFIIQLDTEKKGEIEVRKLVLGLILAVFMIFSTISTTTAFAASKNQLMIINKSTNRLAFFENGKLVRTFKVATGRQTTYTPEGTFTIVNKIKNRPYYKGGIPGGDPRNPLGDRWLGLNARGTYGTTYGIHGNSNPSSIGKYVSSGCVRMYDEEVRWLFDKVQLQTKVIIGQFKSQAFEAIAGKYGYAAQSAPAAPVCKGVCFEGRQLSKGQIGFLIVKKTMPLMQRTKEGKYEVIGTLPVNSTYKVYEINKNLALVNIGGKFVHYNLDRIKIDYLPNAVIDKLNKYYGVQPPAPSPAPKVCKGVCFNGHELSKGQIGFLTVKKTMPLMQRTKEGKYEVIGTLPEKGAYKVYEVNKTLALVNVGGKFVHYNLDRIQISYLPADVIKKVNEYYN